MIEIYHTSFAQPFKKQTKLFELSASLLKMLFAQDNIIICTTMMTFLIIGGVVCSMVKRALVFELDMSVSAGQREVTALYQVPVCPV